MKDIDNQRYTSLASDGAAHCCRLCASTTLEALQVAENMFGKGELFRYEKCLDCGVLQIAELPSGLDRYYPESYYSYADVSPSIKQKLRMFLAVHGPRILFERYDWWLNGAPKSIRDSGTVRNDTIIDIGCGSGELISTLREIGFRSVSGADPFIKDTLRHRNGTLVRKAEMPDVPGRYSLVMMHHSLEHIWHQQEAAAHLFRLVLPGGKCVVRIPTVDSWAWENFGADWVHADAPRHLFLHSRQSITNLLSNAGFRNIRIVDDSTSYGLLGSQKIKTVHRVLDADNSTNFRRHFSPHTIAAASNKAKRLNAASRGDTIAVHAVRPVN